MDRQIDCCLDGLIDEQIDGWKDLKCEKIRWTKKISQMRTKKIDILYIDIYFYIGAKLL